MEKKKKIVFFDGTLMQGGAERVISILSRYMNRENYDVTILLYYNEEVFYEIDSNVKIISVIEKTGSKNIVRNLFWIRTYFKQNADIILSFLAPFNMLAIVANLGLNTPIVVADRNDPRKIPKKYILRKLRDFLYLFASGVVIQTNHNKAYFSKKIQDKSIVIYNPVDLEEKKGFAINTPSEKRIVSVGRLMKQKNQIMLIKAFSEFLKFHQDYSLTIYGDGPERDSLEQFVSEQELTNNVFLPGSVKNVHEQIANAEFFVLSSDFEGMPNALIEAMCIGLPCISTKVSGATDLIQDGINGDLVEIGDCKMLLDRMLRLANNKQLRTYYSNNAIKLNDELSSEKIVKQWLEYLSTIWERYEN